MRLLDYLREFAKKHPGAGLPAGLVLMALEEAEDEPPGLEAELSVAAAARFAGNRSEKMIRGWCRAGLLPGAYQEAEGGRWRIPLRSLQEYLASLSAEWSPAPRRRKRAPWGK